MSKETRPTSKIIQISEIVVEDYDYLKALCEDGSIWERQWSKEKGFLWLRTLEPHKEPVKNNLTTDKLPEVGKRYREIIRVPRDTKAPREITINRTRNVIEVGFWEEACDEFGNITFPRFINLPISDFLRDYEELSDQKPTRTLEFNKDDGFKPTTKTLTTEQQEAKHDKPEGEE